MKKQEGTYWSGGGADMWNLQEAISYYEKQGAPGDQNALIALLREIQTENGGIPEYMLGEISAAYRIRESLLTALIRRIPSLCLAQGHCLEICSGRNCGKHTALATRAEQLQKARGFQLKFVPCMSLCGKGPNVRWDGQLYHKADERLLEKLTADQ